MTDRIKIAAACFDQGFNCAQAVLSAFASEAGLAEESALRLASPFGGGIGRRGQVCGALSGALMALGLRRGNDTPQGKEETYRLAGEFVKIFEERNGSILCRDLIGYDLSTVDGLQAARESEIFSLVCPALVESTAELLEEFLKE